jgi:hypothetical protein
MKPIFFNSTKKKPEVKKDFPKMCNIYMLKYVCIYKL